MSGSTTARQGASSPTPGELADRLLGRRGDLAGGHHQPDRLDLERDAQPEDVDEVVGVEDRHVDAAVGLAQQEALGDQDLGRGAEGVPGDPEALGELGLAQAGARLDVAVEDLLAQRVGGGLDRGYGREREVGGIVGLRLSAGVASCVGFGHMSHHSTI